MQGHKKAEVIQQGLKIGHLVILNAGQVIEDIQGKIMEGDCTHNSQGLNNKSII